MTGSKSSRGFLPKPSHRPYNLGGIPSLARLLWKVETSPLPVKVDEFMLTAQPQGTDNLSTTLTVSTIWVRPETPEDKKPRPGAPVRRVPGGEDL